MRTLELADRRWVDQCVDHFPARSAVASAAIRFLLEEADAKRLVARSAELYAHVLLAFAMASRGLTVRAAFAIDRLPALVDGICRQDNYRTQFYLVRGVLRRFAAFAGYAEQFAAAALVRPDVSLSTEAVPTGPRRRASIRLIDLSYLQWVHRYALFVLNRTQGQDAATPRTASAADLQRAAMIAMCRYAGARPADLHALTFDDLSRGRTWDGTIDSTWRAMHVDRNATGTAKRIVRDLELPPIATRWLRRWMTVRAALEPIAGGAPVFVEISAEGSRHPRPLSAPKRVWQIVAGTDGEFRSSAAHPCLAARDTWESPLDDALDERALPIHQRPELSPTLLRACLGVELVFANASAEAMTDVLLRRLGMVSRAGIFRYRELARITRPRARVARPPRIA